MINDGVSGEAFLIKGDQSISADSNYAPAMAA